MCVEILDEVMARFPGRGDELVVGIVIADCTTPEGELYLTRKSFEWIANRARLTTRELEAIIESFKATGWLYRVRLDHRGDIGDLYSFREPGKHTLPRPQH